MSARAIPRLPVGGDSARSPSRSMEFPNRHNYSANDWYSPPRISRAQTMSGAMAKRFLDIIASSLGLILLFPFMILIALAVVVDSPGASLYRTYRVGKNGRLFRFHKFRTM